MPEDKVKVLGLIPARGGSKGIPNKNLMKVEGKELVRLAVEIGLSISELDYLICSTDSQRIADCAKDSGAFVPFIRPAVLAQDDTPMLPVIEHAILEIERIFSCTLDCVVLLDPTAPMRTPDDINDALRFFKKNKPDLLVSVHRGHHNPYFNMLEKKGEFFCLPKGVEENYGSRQVAPLVYQINTVVWIYSRNAIINERVRIPKSTLIYEFPESRSIDLDTPDDLMKINYFLKSNTPIKSSNES